MRPLRRLSVAVALGVALAFMIAATWCCQRHNALYVESEAGGFVRIRNSSGIFLVKDELLAGMFGPNWKSFQMFFSCHRWVSRDAKEEVMSKSNLWPVSRSAQVVLMVPREDAAPASYLLYIPELGRLCSLSVDMRKYTATPGECSTRDAQYDKLHLDGSLSLGQRP